MGDADLVVCYCGDALKTDKQGKSVRGLEGARTRRIQSPMTKYRRRKKGSGRIHALSPGLAGPCIHTAWLLPPSTAWQAHNKIAQSCALPLSAPGSSSTHPRWHRGLLTAGQEQPAQPVLTQRTLITRFSSVFQAPLVPHDVQQDSDREDARCGCRCRGAENPAHCSA